MESFVIPNASDNVLFEGRTDFELPVWTLGRTLFPHIGAIGLLNNGSLIIDAAQIVEEQGERAPLILFIGDGPERKKLQQRVVEEHIGNVRFLGNRPKTELAGWLRASRATLATNSLPIQDTWSPNKVFDSFAAGRAVIQNTSGWLKDLFDRTGCGINVVPDDPVSLANAILDLTRSPEKAERMGAAGKELAMTEFSRDRLAKKYLNHLTQIVARSK